MLLEAIFVVINFCSLLVASQNQGILMRILVFPSLLISITFRWFTYGDWWQCWSVRWLLLNGRVSVFGSFKQSCTGVYQEFSWHTNTDWCIFSICGIVFGWVSLRKMTRSSSICLDLILRWLSPFMWWSSILGRFFVIMLCIYSIKWFLGSDKLYEWSKGRLCLWSVNFPQHL